MWLVWVAVLVTLIPQVEGQRGCVVNSTFTTCQQYVPTGTFTCTGSLCRATSGCFCDRFAQTYGDECRQPGFDISICKTPYIQNVTRTSASLPSTGGTLTIFGWEFDDDTAGGSLVNISGIGPLGWKACTVQSWNFFRIICDPGPGWGSPTLRVFQASTRNLSNSFSITYNNPSISSFNPSRPPTVGNVSVTINGANFGPVEAPRSVSFRGIPLNTSEWYYVSHTQLVFRIPPGTGTQTVSLTTGSVTIAANIAYANPVISTISPANGPCSSSEVRITGSNFGPSGLEVFVDNVRATVISHNETFALIQTPFGDGASDPIYVRNAGLNSGSLSYKRDNPVITMFTPNGPTFGSIITITGTNFGFSGSILLVGDSGAATCSTSFYNNTRIVCSSPEFEGANVEIRLTVNTQRANAVFFAYDAPVLSSIFPQVGRTNGGFNVTLTGFNYGVNPSVFLGTNSSFVLCTLLRRNRTSLTARIPEGAGSDLSMYVKVGTRNTNFVSFSYLPPNITSISPRFAPSEGGTVLTITGSNLGKQGTVDFVDAPCVAVGSGFNHETITCAAPQSTAAGVSPLILVRVTSQWTAQTVSSSTLFTYAPPVILAVSPANQTIPTAGGLLTISGSSFHVAGNITINGVLVVTTSWTHTRIICEMPSGRGTVPIVLSQQGGSSTSSFLTYGVPFITSIDPSEGQTTGGSFITISGGNFDTFGSINLGGRNATVASWSHSSIVFALPPGQGDSLSVALVTGVRGDSAVLSGAFSYSPPSISSISPSNGPTSGFYSLTVVGNSFGVIGSISVGGQNCHETFRNHSRIVCLVPPGQNSIVAVIVKANGSLVESVPMYFRYDPPTISSLSTVTGGTRGGDPLCVYGTNFGLGPAILIREASCPLINSTHSSACCLTPPGVGRDLALTLMAGDQQSNSLSFSYRGPVIANITHGELLTAGGSRITISGHDLSSEGVVFIGTKVCVGSVFSQTLITCQVPDGQGTAIPVQVSTQSGLSNFVSLSYSPPFLSSRSLVSLNTAGGETLELLGRNFGTSASVTIGGGSCTKVFQSHTTIVCLTPQGQGLNQPIVITVSGQTNRDNTSSYSPPSITGVTPSLFPTSGGTIVTLSGLNFGSDRITSSVTIGGNPCPPTGINFLHNIITCIAPRGQGRLLPVVVEIAGQTASAPLFSYSPPVINSIDPSSGQTGGGYLVTLFGSDFGVSGFVSVNNVSVSIASYTDSVVSFVMPSGRNAVSVLLNASSQIFSIGFTFESPAISGLSYSPLSTSGGALITVIGSNFDSNGSLLIGTDISCTPTSWGHSRIICSLGEGEGLGLAVNLLTIGGLNTTSIPLAVNYAGPSIASIFPSSSPTAGGGNLTINGFNFGRNRSTSVSIQSSPCRILAQTHTTLVCRVPAGQGINIPIFVTVSGQTSSGFAFSHDDPILSSIFPPFGPSVGNVPFQLQGMNFGLVASVSVGFSDCPIINQTHTAIFCLLPPGQGTDRPVRVSVSSRLSNAINFNYFGPSISSISPLNGPTFGGWDLTLFGSDFGTSGAVYIGASVCSTVTYNATYIVCRLNSPAGESRNRAVRVLSSSVFSNSVLFSFDPPSVSSVIYALAPTAGGTSITIEGSNFGIAPVVLLGERSCPVTSLNLGSVSSSIICTLPSGSGLNLRSVVRAGDQESVFSFSYDPPLITSIDPLSSGTPGGTEMVISGSNFGLLGTVFIGSSVCLISSSQYSHTGIRCMIPPGSGAQSVRVFVSGANASNSFLFNYLPPNIVSISPVNGPTTGGYPLTLTGSNFGLSGTVTVDGRSCSIDEYTHSRIRCFAPAGTGADTDVIVESGFSSNRLLFSYDAPVYISHSPPTISTDGSTLLSFSGSNFGTNTSLIAVVTSSLTYSLCSPFNASHNSFSCIAGPGAGAALLHRIQVDGRLSTSFSISYLPPSINLVSGCPIQSGSVTEECPIEGNVVLTVSGFNFGTVQDSPVVFVDGKSCTDLSVLVPHRSISCTLPANRAGGRSVSVAVSVAGQSGSANLLSYVFPQIFPGTLKFQGFANPTAYPSSVFLSSTANSSLISFRGKNFGSNASAVQLRYGLSFTEFNSKPFQCTSISFSGPLNDQVISCQLFSGIGRDLVLQAKVGEQFSNEGIDTISYPQPLLLPNSIGSPFQATMGSLYLGTKTEGELVTFKGKFFGSFANLIKVTYGPVGNTGLYQCTQVALTTPDIQIQCRTSPGEGSDLAFQLQAFNQISGVSDFFFSYPLAPVVSAVRGCLDSGNSTTNCPTMGQTLITILGNYFTPNDISVRIDGNPCVIQSFISVNSLTCLLPEGVGFFRPVVVATGELFSRSQPLLSYSPPSLNSISGCSACARSGGDVITLTGSHFGRSSALVFVAEQLCTNVNHTLGMEHSRLTCVLPPSSGGSKAVFLIQNRGKVSPNSLSIFFALCPLGQRAVFGTTACSNCSTGAFSASVGQLACDPCPSGTISSSVGSTTCTRCSAGRFSVTVSATLGASVCSGCSAGYFSESSGSSACLECAAGRFSNVSSTSCVLCPSGSFTGLTAQSSCLLCSPGSVSPVPGRVKCEICEAGKFAAGPGQFSCSNCPSGRFQLFSGQSFCSACGLGSSNPLSGLAVCTACDDGFFANSTGLTSCFSCSAGFFSKKADKEGPSICSPCPAGEFISVPGQSKCLKCLEGTFSSSQGASTCSSCAPGFEAPSLGQSQCMPCTPGSFAPFSASVSCSICPVGKFSNISGSTVCLDCALGSFQSLQGQTSCQACPLGSANSAIGQISCTTCSSGSFSSSVGKSSCDRCSEGTFSLSGSSVCTLCSPGTANSLSGQAFCQICGSGYFTNTSASEACVACPSGKISNAPSSTTCTQCLEGRFSASPASFICSLCEAGKFSGKGAASCEVCPPGSFQTLQGQSSCTVCPSGSFSIAFGAVSCTSCPAGRFSSNAGSLECRACPSGSFQSRSGQTSCSICPAGSSALLESSVECGECSQGTFSLQNSSACTPCPVGTFASNPASSACSECSAGSFSSAVGSFSCSSCLPGTFINSSRAVECSRCEIGRFQGLAGQASCVPCSPGTFSDRQGVSSCTSCPLGTFASQRNQVACSLCGPGTFSDVAGLSACKQCSPGFSSSGSGSIVCSACTPGTFTSVIGSPICSPCPVGKFASSSGRSSCEDCSRGRAAPSEGLAECPLCSPGYSAPSTGSSSCLACSLGQFSSSSGGSTCQNCSLGTFSNLEGSITCTSCSLGWFASNLGLSSCSRCSVGSFAELTGSSACSLCPIGRSAGFSGLAVCSPCLPGSFSDTLGTSVCQQCTPGTFSGSSGQSLCLNCTAGTSSFSFGSAFCESCPAGRFSSSGEPSCSPCSPGSFQDDAGKSGCKSCLAGNFAISSGEIQCSPCEPGYNSSTEGSQFCSMCPAGYHSPLPGGSSCLPCPAGRFSSAGAAVCQVCSPGSFSRSAGSSSCSLCSSGQYQSNSGQTACLSCVPGRISSGSGRAECSPCAPGSYADTFGMSFCFPCDPGYFSLLSGASTCQACSTGSFGSGFGSDSCELCPLGYWNNETAQEFCRPCSPGSYQSSTGSTSCLSCGIGTSNAFAGQGQCFACESGFFSDQTGLESCFRCSPGKFSTRLSSIGPTVCQDCLPGKFTSIPGSAICEPCALGRFSDFRSATACSLCSPGKVTLGVGSDACDVCAQGRFSQTFGAITCSPCDPGTFQPLTGQIRCERCPLSTFQDQEGQVDCKSCPIGTFSFLTGRPFCQSCPLGKFGNRTGQTVCNDCPIGKFQSNIGQSRCTDCEAGKFIEVTSAEQCSACDPGKFNNVTAGTSCWDCPRGQFQSTPGETSCLSCLAGYFAKGARSGFCEACPVGRFNDVRGSVDCRACPVGKFNDKVNATRCQDCRPGTFAQGTIENIVCAQCPLGKYNNASAQADCIECEVGRFQDDLGQTVCSSCPNGTVSTSTGAFVCTACPAGKTSLGFNENIFCDSCALGKYADIAGLPECLKCPPGSFADKLGSASCSLCPEGSFQDEEGTVFCKSCSPGRFSDERGSASCNPCPRGTFNTLEAQSLCQACPLGRFANDTGSLECLSCAPGTFQSAVGGSLCYSCPLNSVAKDSGMDSCELCPPGRSTNGLQRSLDCEPCLVGYQQPSFGLNCTMCPAGFFSPVPGADVCQECDPGTFGNSSGSTACALCQIGKYRDSLSSSSTRCFDCAIGTFSPGLGREGCEVCPSGRFSQSLGATSCIPCAIGSAGSNGTCASCSPGKFSNVAGLDLCKPCEPGKFNSNWNLTTCFSCQPGTQTAASGSSVCFNCSPGRAFAGIGAFTCDLCEPGRFAFGIGNTGCLSCAIGTYASRPGMTSCLPCEIGTASAFEGKDLCPDCGVGSFQNKSGQAECIPCFAGTFAATEGQPSCTRCPLGSATESSGSKSCEPCSRGFISSQLGSEACSGCDPGRFNDRTGSSFCKECPPGFFTKDSGNPSCSPCRGGTFTTRTGTSSCDLCPGGKYSDGIALITSCNDCREGTFSRNGSSTCEACAVGRVTLRPGSPECESCDSLSRPNAFSTECLCQVGYFARSDAPVSALCYPCPVGADCSQEGTRQDTLKAIQGWWTDIERQNLVYYRCLTPEQCLGGVKSDCRQYHTGPLCATCTPGYYLDSRSTCSVCPSSGRSWVYFVILALLIFSFLYLQFYIVVRSGRDLMRDAKFEDLKAIEQLEDWDEYELAALQEHNEEKANLPPHTPPVPTPNFTYKLKIVLGFSQIVSALLGTIEIDWPSTYRRVVSYLNFANFDFIKASAVECVVATQYYARWIVYCSIPLILFVLIGILYLLPKYFLSLKKNSDQYAIRRSRRRFWRIFLFSLFLMYPIVSQTVLKLYICKEVNGTSYLLSDFRLQCYTRQYNNYAGAGIIMILLYPIGIPAFLLIMLLRQMSELKSPGVQAELGFLYAGYNYEHWWFEFIDIFHKLFLVVLVGFFPDGFQLPIAMAVCIGYTFLILTIRPFSRKGDDRLILLAQTEIFLLLTAGYNVRNAIEIDRTTDIALSVVLLLSMILFLVYFVFQAFEVVNKLWRRRKASKKKAEKEKGQTMHLAVKNADQMYRHVDPELLDLRLTRNPIHDPAKSIADTGAGSDVELFLNPLHAQFKVITSHLDKKEDEIPVPEDPYHERNLVDLEEEKALPKKVSERVIRREFGPSAARQPAHPILESPTSRPTSVSVAQRDLSDPDTDDDAEQK